MDRELSSFSCLVVFGLWILLASNSNISVSLKFLCCVGLGRTIRNHLLFEAMYFHCAMNLRGTDVG
jgi:hypothetical protein